MNWELAQELINIHLIQGLHFDPVLVNRIIIETPINYHCTHYNYHGENGFKVKIGFDTYIEIPWSMLENVFTRAINLNNSIYNRAVIRDLYLQQINNHGCHVHVVGQIFVKAGIAVRINARNYKILENPIVQ